MPARPALRPCTCPERKLLFRQRRRALLRRLQLARIQFSSWLAPANRCGQRAYQHSLRLCTPPPEPDVRLGSLADIASRLPHEISTRRHLTKHFKFPYDQDLKKKKLGRAVLKHVAKRCGLISTRSLPCRATAGSARVACCPSSASLVPSRSHPVALCFSCARRCRGAHG